MILKDISFANPQNNIAFDDVLLQLADQNEAIEYLRFWESLTYFIVLGRIGKAEEDVNLITTQADGIPVLRRSSGGGTVLQGPGCLNYTFVLSKQNHPILNDLRASYAWISSKVIDALATNGIEAVFRPISDIALAQSEKKFSGNAQRRGKTHILHHGTILYDFNLDLITKYLTMPKEIPEYRKLRSHRDFVTNISIAPNTFKQTIIQAFEISNISQPMTPQEHFSLRNYLK